MNLKKLDWIFVAIITLLIALVILWLLPHERPKPAPKKAPTIVGKTNLA